MKEEILFAMRDLLHETVVSEKAVASENKESEGMLEVPVFVRTRSSYETLDLKVKDIVGGCDKQFPKGDARTQKAIFGVLAELVLVRRGDLDIEKITPHVISGIETKAADVNADALKVLHLILEFHNFKQLQPFIAKFTAATTKLVASGSTNVVPEALRVLGSIGKKAAGQSGTESLAKDLYKATMTQLVQKDVTQKIKLTSISTMAIVLASFGLSGEMKNVVPVFIERLGNEVTRQPVLRALARIANSEAKVDLSLFASNSAIIKDMTSFFRKVSSLSFHRATMLRSSLCCSACCFLLSDAPGAAPRDRDRLRGADPHAHVELQGAGHPGRHLGGRRTHRVRLWRGEYTAAADCARCAATRTCRAPR